eukprot:471284-Prymnesium_polylepis.1
MRAAPFVRERIRSLLVSRDKPAAGIRRGEVRRAASEVLQRVKMLRERDRAAEVEPHPRAARK